MARSRSHHSHRGSSAPSSRRERCLLLLAYVGAERWAVTDLVLGKFRFADDRAGQRLLVRDEDEIIGWDPNLKPHLEPRRAAEPFLNFIRTEAAGRSGNEDYFVTRAPLATATTMFTPSTAATGFSITSYTMTVSGAMGARWNVFPSAVAIYMGTTTEPGAPGGGTTAVTTAIGSWDNDCRSNVNYTFLGTDDGTHTQGLHAPDGRNTILFERDLSSYGISDRLPVQRNSYSGTLGIGGITSGSGTNTLERRDVRDDAEGDVEMNRGIANCTLLFSNGDFNSAVTHEVGHTLGFRHSDQNPPAPAPARRSVARMLEQRDHEGVRLERPERRATGLGPARGPECLSGRLVHHVHGAVDRPAAGIGHHQRRPAGDAVGHGERNDSFSYQWFTGTSGTGAPISGQTQSTLTVAPTTSTAYWVRVSNSCGSANSATATITVACIGPQASAVRFEWRWEVRPPVAK